MAFSDPLRPETYESQIAPVSEAPLIPIKPEML